MLARALAAAVLVALVVVGLALTPQVNNVNNTSSPDSAIRIIPIVQVYRNGELIYTKVGDPPTNNLAAIFFSAIAPRYKTDGTAFSITITAMDGTAGALNPASNTMIDEHTLWVIAGTGNNPPAYTDYSMNLAGYGEAQVVNYYYNSTAKAWILEVSGSITFSTSANITEVGLATDILGSASISSQFQNPADDPAANLLVFRDTLPSPIKVSNGDSITIKYTIMFVFP